MVKTISVDDIYQHRFNHYFNNFIVDNLEQAVIEDTNGGNFATTWHEFTLRKLAKYSVTPFTPSIYSRSLLVKSFQRKKIFPHTE